MELNDDRLIKSGPEATLVQKSPGELKSHWDNTYHKCPVENLGWYEANPDPSLSMIEYCKLDKSASILNVGAGASTIIDVLLAQGFNNIIANDISSIALKKLMTRLGEDTFKVKWIEDDLVNPVRLHKLGKIDVWHDRAVLHFFTEKKDQESYFGLIKEMVKIGGHVIIAVFNLDGASKCSGLPVCRYSQEMLSSRLGDDFELIQSFDYLYIMPSGNTRPYIYSLFKRKKED